MRKSITGPFPIRAKRLFISPRIGVSIFPEFRTKTEISDMQSPLNPVKSERFRGPGTAQFYGTVIA